MPRAHGAGFPRFTHYSNRMMPWLAGERIRRAFSEGYRRLTPLLWNFTVFDGDAPFDEDIRAILRMEEAIESMPDWAMDIAIQIDALPHCGHLSFPAPVDAVIRGIGAQGVDPAYTFCFEASFDTKRRVLEIADDLNRWVRDGAENAITTSLGVRTELKRLLVAFVAAYLRESVDTILTNDAGLLTIQTNDSPHTRELRDLRLRLVEAAAGTGFDVSRFFAEFDHPWLCHHRLFDQIRTALERIGREESRYSAEEARLAAVPQADAMRAVYDDRIAALDAWLDGKPDGGADLGEPTPVKRWLAAALRKKMTIFRHDTIAETLAV